MKHHHNTGLTAPQKFLLQLAAAIAFLCLMRYEGMLSPNLYIPFFNTHLVLPWVVYMIFAAFVIIGTVNAVNITDGIDGLSSSVTVPVAVFFAVLGGMWQGFGQLGVFAGALVGGLLGFLCYNHYPAKVFMGDTGSLFLGGAVAALAFAYDMPLILLLVGFVYLCETLSDIIQVTYFKLTHGKRIFKMAPSTTTSRCAAGRRPKSWRYLPPSAPCSAFWLIWALWIASAHNQKAFRKGGEPMALRTTKRRPVGTWSAQRRQGAMEQSRKPPGVLWTCRFCC